MTKAGWSLLCDFYTDVYVSRISKTVHLKCRYFTVYKLFLNFKHCFRDFPGSPVVRTPSFQCRACRFDPGKLSSHILCKRAQSLSLSDSLKPHGLQPTRLLHPWDSPGKNTGAGCHFFPQQAVQCGQKKKKIPMLLQKDDFDSGTLCNMKGKKCQNSPENLCFSFLTIKYLLPQRFKYMTIMLFFVATLKSSCI